MKFEKRLEEQCIERYDYRVLQMGSLPLSPDADYDPAVEHRCTSILIWPGNLPVSAQSSVLSDPCFTLQGYHQALKQLEDLKMSVEQIGWIFITHPHRDHQSNLANFIGQHLDTPIFQDGKGPLKGLTTILLPGHAPSQRGLWFRTITDRIACVCGDAILDEHWLRAWKYYWPNFYQEAEILQTWSSVAVILAHADVIIPGHGAPITVTTALLEHLIKTFDQAEYAGQCPAVRQTLEHRLEHLSIKKKSFSP